MGVVKVIAWFAIFVIGLMVLGLISVLNGGAWTTVFLVWLAFWIVVAVISEAVSPGEDW